MPRFYLSPSQWDNADWKLDGDEARHCVRVLRLREGDSCTLFDGRGNRREAKITSIQGGSCVFFEVDREQIRNTLLPALTLCQAIPKGSNMDWIIQKAVELGVSRILPLLTERTIVRYKQDEIIRKREKWQRIALEACKQCGQDLLPVVEVPASFSLWIKDNPLGMDHLGIIASLTKEAVPIRSCLEKAREENIKMASYLVGPEGDFTPEETALALSAGFHPVTLGSIILRVETATLMGLSMLRYALD